MLGTNGDLEDSLQAELELIFRAQRNKRLIDRERDFSVFRSGSAPPTVEGSRSAVDSLLRSSNFGVVNGNVGLSEDEIWSHPAYLSYNYSHDHVNPPLLPKEHWRVAQRFQGGGCSRGGRNSVGPVAKLRMNKLVGDGSSSSLFSVQPGFSVQNVEEDDLRLSGANASNLFELASSEWLDRGLNGKAGLQTSGLGTRRKSFADILQVGLDQPASLHLPRPASYNAFGDIAETCIIDSNLSELCNTMGPLEGLSSRTASPGLVGSLGNPGSHAFASALGILSSTAPDNQLVSISPCSGLPIVGNGNGATMQNGHSSSVMALDEIAATLCSLRLPQVTHADLGNCIQAKLNSNLDNHPNLICNLDDFGQKTLQQQLTGKSTPDYLSFSTKYADVARVNGAVQNHNALEVGSAGEPRVPRKSFSSANLLSKAQPLGLGNWERSILQDQNAIARSAEFVGRLPRSHSFNQKLNSAIMNHLDEGICETGRSWNSFANQGGNDLQLSAMDPYLGRTSDYATHAAATSCVPHIKNDLGNPSGDVDGIWNAYLKVLLAQQKQLYELSLLGKSSGLDPGHPRNPSYGRDMPCLRSSMSSPSESGGFSNDQVMAFSSKMRNSGGPTGSWQSDVGINVEKRKVSSLLDEFKINKARSFELSDIVGHVVEFSTDQYGSRFIQQKLETAAFDEKEKIFPEIIPLARTLMTDVFGNYVIQKFFEHGTRSQRAELASQLTGHMLPLSLQMYGCRVIQKALEVVDVDEQTQMVAELDGSVMKCVRDQNGNHVIQKCIGCVPEDRIQFIISAFYGQVASLSAHPYGCRVIQRILEHCEDTHTHQIIMDEILQSLCTLAEDQYGNYVIQHVLEHGKPHEKIAIIRKLAGQIVRMSQQKFASNVVEKCLTYGGPEEHQLLVNEMLGSTDENEPLQVMMKDPFGNYVVQKVLETCSDQNLELILSRIKVHLNVLKRYTYGKHIVSRVEKLILTGERRIGQSSSVSS